VSKKGHYRGGRARVRFRSEATGARAMEQHGNENMHTPETQQKFIERRAQGWSYARIAAELSVAKSTLIEWSRKFRFELQNRCALETDELRDRVLGSRQARVARLAERLARIEGELGQRTLADVS